MLLSAKNLTEIKYNTKRQRLKKADAEMIIALVPGSMMAEALKITADNPEPKKAEGLDAKQRKDYDKKMDAYQTAMKDFGFKILSASVIDDKGDPVFKDLAAFEALAPAIQDEIMDAVYEYNGMGKGSVAEIVKN